MTPGSASAQVLPERHPERGELVHVRSRRWLVDDIIPPSTPGESPLVRLAAPTTMRKAVAGCVRYTSVKFPEDRISIAAPNHET